MAQRLITSTDDPLYVNTILTIANIYEEKTPGANAGCIPRFTKSESGKQYCPQGCVGNRCLGHPITVKFGTISRHPEWKNFIYHNETYVNGKVHQVMYFYEDEEKADLKFKELVGRIG